MLLNCITCIQISVSLVHPTKKRDNSSYYNGFAIPFLGFAGPGYRGWRHYI